MSERTGTYFRSEPAQQALRRLAASSQLSVVGIASAIGVSPSTLHRLFTRDRLRFDAADHIAVALGYHPCELWPEWFPVQ